MVTVITITFYIVDNEFDMTYMHKGYFLDYKEAAQFIADNKAAGNSITPISAKREQVEARFFY